MNKIESKLSRSSAAAEKNRLMQLRRRAGERRQLFIWEINSVFLNCMMSCQGAWQKKGETPLFLLLPVDIENGKLKNWGKGNAFLPKLD